MSQTILIESHPELSKIFSINLNTYAGTDIIERKNGQEAMELLNILPTINLIITQAKVGTENTALELYQYLLDRELTIPMIILGDVPELKHKVLCLKEPVEWEVMVKHAASLLGINSQKLQEKIKPDFTRVPTNYFYEIERTPCDIFIRIKKSPSEYQFVKRIHSKDIFNLDTIIKYEKQGLRDFWVPTDYQQYFVNFVTNNLVTKLESNLDVMKRVQVNSNAFQIVSDQIRRFGLDTTMVELSDSSIKSMVKSVNDSPELSDLLKMLFTSKISYAYQHAHLICVIGNFILSKQSWYKPKHLEILSFAAFFSDITLKSLEQSKIHSQEELENSKLDIEEKEQVLTHAKDAVRILKDHPKFDDYLEMVILQHHGTTNGVGFSVNPPEELHPLSKVFIIADAFVKAMLDPDAPKNKLDILTILYDRFQNDSYQKVIKVLEQKIE